MARTRSEDIEQFEDGSAAFFSNREIPWHKLGIVTEGALTAQDALKTAQLNWEVKKSESPVYASVLAKDGVEGDFAAITDKQHFATYRYHPKTHKPDMLGIVGTRYTPVQNLEAFDFLNALADESGAVFETAGALDNGKKVFMTMKLPSHMMVGGIDRIDLYLQAWNTHDGTSSFNVMVSPIRIVCANTLAAAIAHAERSFRWRHTASITNKVQVARETLDLTFKYVEAFEKEAELLMSQKMTDKAFKTLIEELFPIKDDAKVTANTENTREVLAALWKAPTQENIKNTKWAAYNTVAEYADWAKPIKSKTPDVARATRIITGKNERIKNKALALLK